MKPKDKICIAWAHNKFVDTEFAISIFEILRTRVSRIGGYHCVEGTGLLSKSRNLMVKHFLDHSDAEWLLMLDSDERFPLSTFDKLVAAADAAKAPVVAGLYFAALFPDGRNIRPTPLIFKVNEEGAVVPYDDYPENAVIQVVAAGTGCLLMHRSALEKFRTMAAAEVAQDWMWFADGPIPGNRWLSEDLMFCSRLNQLDIPIVAHTGAILGHRKSIWVDDETYKAWRQFNEPGTGLEELK